MSSILHDLKDFRKSRQAETTERKPAGTRKPGKETTGTQHFVARIIHVGPAEGRALCRNSANRLNSKPHGAVATPDGIATEVPAQQGLRSSSPHAAASPGGNRSRIVDLRRHRRLPSYAIRADREREQSTLPSGEKHRASQPAADKPASMITEER
jgi:hypothetical protein